MDQGKPRSAGSKPRSAPADGPLATKAALRAAARLGLSNRTFSRIVGLSEASVSRMNSGTFVLTPGDKAFDLALMFVRLFRSLDAMVGGDETVARAWLVNVNAALDGRPVEKIQTVAGLIDAIAYLDARRAIL